MLDFTKLILNWTQIEDAVEVRVELGKKFVRENICLSWHFFLFNLRGECVGAEINGNIVVVGGRAGLFK